MRLREFLRPGHILTREAIFHVVVFAVAVAALALALQKSDTTVPLLSPEPVKVLPAEGVKSFDASLFCVDPLTQVRAFPSPDASGTTYQLTRVRDGVTETVTLVVSGRGDIILATHYYDTTQGQQSEPAVVSPDALKCVTTKSR